MIGGTNVYMELPKLVYSIMGACNRVYVEAACASTTLFDILRNKWGFDGYVVSDCGAIIDI